MYRDPYVTVIFKELTKEMIRSLDEKVFSCVVLTSAHFFFFSQFSEWLQQTDITSSSSTEHDARTVFIRLSEKNVLFFQVTEGLNEFGVIASFRITSALMIIQNSTHYLMPRLEFISCGNENQWKYFIQTSL